MTTLSLHRRHSTLANPQAQIALLESIDLSHLPEQGNFDSTLKSSGWQKLQPAPLEIFQINLGKLCNMTCQHCHVDAAPDRRENMDRPTIDACLAALDQTAAHTVDITGGAPELNPHFRYLVEQCVSRGKHVIDRCNLTVLLLPTMTDLPAWFAELGVEVVCSLPHYRQPNTDKQRGDGTFTQSIEALRRLNAVGYGQGNPQRQLTLVSNPTDTSLPCNQAALLEQMWKKGLWENHEITFDRLISISNMPIVRQLEWLEQSGNLQGYMELLVNSFNPATIAGLMCRNTISVSWDGKLYDCDFNQMLELEVQLEGNQKAKKNSRYTHIRDFSPELLAQRTIVTGRHCFGCTAGKGSSCSGAIAAS
ncbi:putative Fe-S oxidoreductase [Synechococcus sp. PCC 7502]|uniref:arsenosugar biosynthesis radical SAM (seleno)protein ArsS n=1 Tax=Synechococcus sp. PCC 7502 TaxID=1173263 RepID=UPI00029FE434|nr:arsenosugar biosynthesis radical SAM (seleno)protein ArsS [Synechococcus sp. PCC 7502]AFY73865.1 putative Fe-S oxidoreductase [Synechococcus sp. PCC 7502]